MTRPLDQVYASRAVISALSPGFDMANMLGRSEPFTRTKASTTFLSKQPGATPTAPMRHEGLMCSIVSARLLASYVGLPTCANSFCSPLRKLPSLPSLERHMTPREFVTEIFDLGTPASCESNFKVPKFAEPAPWKRKVWLPNSPTKSVHLGFLNLMAPISAATATAAVPWMSSLYVRNLSRYSANRGNASLELKSSNCSRHLFPKTSAAACMNSPMRLSLP
mmetsp:Transcript_64284/g.209640  ORF Transcript_64284/g.209640 Transcript_64284/m.209640 type:complete len:222 (-) Transcript_64284:1182-1847(-)